MDTSVLQKKKKRRSSPRDLPLISAKVKHLFIKTF